MSSSTRQRLLSRGILALSVAVVTVGAIVCSQSGVSQAGQGQAGAPQWGKVVPKPDGSEKQVFLPGLVSDPDRHEFGSAFSGSGKELYFGVDFGGRSEIWSAHWDGEIWSEPAVLLSHHRFGYNDPMLSPDEARLYFISDRSLNGNGDAKDIDIWFIERDGSQWSEPVNAGPIINSQYNEYFVSFTQGGTMYFASNRAAEDERRGNFDIYSAAWRDGVYQEPIVLGPNVNTKAYEGDVFVALDESYLIFAATRRSGYGRGDLYISFKQDDGSWSKSKNMGEIVNGEGHELCPFVTADGKFFFFTSEQDIYWMNASAIDKLR